MKYGAEVDADIKLSDKGTSKRFTKQGGKQYVNAADQVTDVEIMRSADLVLTTNEGGDIGIWWVRQDVDTMANENCLACRNRSDEDEEQIDTM